MNALAVKTTTQLNLNFSEPRLKTKKEAALAVFDSYPKGYLFWGWQLKDDIVEKYDISEKSSVDTFLRYLRKYRKETCKSLNKKSFYKKV